jgi:hypothetical protein
MGNYYDFAGRRINIPGTYVKRVFPDNSSAGAITGRVVIMGEAKNGGIPFDAFESVEDVLNIVSDPTQAKNVFGGGDLYYGAEFYLTPTTDERFNKPQSAICLVVNQMTQAEINLKDSGANNILVLKSKKFGTDGNLYAIKLSAGSNTGKMVEVLYKGESVLKKDDVQLPLFDIRYIGTGSVATMSITATKITTTVTGTTGEDLDITLADYTDLGSLINFINNNPAYTCTLSGKSDEKADVFDIVTAQDIKTAEYSVVGTVEAIIRQLSSLEDLDVTFASGATRVIPANLTSFEYFSGGSVSAATTQNWTDAFEKLKKYQLNNIVVMSGSETIHQLAKAHVEAMNDIEIRRYRQCGFGAGSSVNTKALRIKEMKSLNSAYVEYCVSEFDRFDYISGERRTFEPYYLYALVAGLRYANNVGMDIVFKYLNVLSTPEVERSDISDYLDAGATLIQKSDDATSGNLFTIVGNNTTFQGSQVTRTNPAVVYMVNVLTKDQELKITEEIRKLDEVANSVIIAKIQNWLITELYPYYKNVKKWITDAPNGQKAFDRVEFSISGEVFTAKAVLTMSVTPRFAFITNEFIVPGQTI